MTDDMMTDDVRQQIERLFESWGGPAGLRKRKEKLDRDFDFIWSHTEEWREKYPDQWVAIHDGKLFAVDSDPDSLWRKLREAGVPVGEAIIRLVLREEPVIVA